MIIIIGASGFIGTYLVDELIKNGYDVLATGRRLSALQYYKENNIKSIELDITNPKDFDKLPTEGVEAVVLLAALLPANLTEDNPYAYIDVNVKGTLNVLEYCRRNNVKKVLSTTSYADIMGYWQKDIALKDNTPRSFNLEDDHTCYVISKNAATDFILHYNAKYNMCSTIFRLPPVYGVGPHSEIYVDGKLYKSGFQKFIDNAVNGDPIEIYGDKNVSRDVVSVKDVVSAFIGAIRSDKASGIYNISSGIPTTLEEQAVAIIDTFSPDNNKSKIIYRPEKSNNSKSYLFDITKAKQDFDYNPKFKLFKDLIVDYKKDLEDGYFATFFIDREKK